MGAHNTAPADPFATLRPRAHGVYCVPSLIVLVFWVKVAANFFGRALLQLVCKAAGEDDFDIGGLAVGGSGGEVHRVLLACFIADAEGLRFLAVFCWCCAGLASRKRKKDLEELCDIHERLMDFRGQRYLSAVR